MSRQQATLVAVLSTHVISRAELFYPFGVFAICQLSGASALAIRADLDGALKRNSTTWSVMSTPLKNPRFQDQDHSGSPSDPARQSLPDRPHPTKNRTHRDFLGGVPALLTWESQRNHDRDATE
jgi:hypothetical protein